MALLRASLTMEDDMLCPSNGQAVNKACFLPSWQLLSGAMDPFSDEAAEYGGGGEEDPTLEEPFLITDAHIWTCFSLAAIALLYAPLRNLAAFCWMKLSTRRAMVQPPPPLTTLSASLHGSPDAMHNPFSMSRLVMTTARGACSTSSTPAAHQSLPSSAIPLLTEIGRISPPPAPSNLWTVSKRDVLRRRQAAAGAQEAQQQQQQQAGLPPPQQQQALASPEGRGLLSRFNATLRGWQGRYPNGEPPPEPASVGWDAELLAQCRRNAQHMSSLEGLESSQAYKEWRSEGNGRSEDQVKHKLFAYQGLRRADPDAFRSLLARPTLADSDLLAVPRWLLALEYLLTLAITLWTLLMAAAPALPLGPGSAAGGTEGGRGLAAWLSAVQLLPVELSALPLLAWLALQLMSWLRGHTSALGMALGLYCVYEDPAYPEHVHVASAAQVILCSAVEAVFFGSTLTAGAVYSLTRILLSREPQSRRSFGQAAVGTHAVREVARSIRAVGPFLPPSPSSIGRAMRPPPSGLVASPLGLRGSSWPLRAGLADLTPYAAADAAAAAAGRSVPSSGGTSIYSWGIMFSKKKKPEAAAATGEDAAGRSRGATPERPSIQGARVGNTPGSLW